MEIYNSIANWTGWPTLVALLIIAGAYGYFILQKQIEYIKEENESLKYRIEELKGYTPDTLATRLSNRLRILSEDLEKLESDHNTSQEKVLKKETELSEVKTQIENLRKQTKNDSIVVYLIFLLGIILFCSFSVKALEPPPPPTPAPISKDLRKELCAKLDEKNLNPICIEGRALLASDTLELFKAKFKPGKTTVDDIVNLFGEESEYMEEIDPFIRYNAFQYDLAGTGINRIVISRGFDDNIVYSIVFIHPEIITPLPQATVADLCNRLNLENRYPCIKTTTVYAQDFFMAFKGTFEDKLFLFKSVELLKPYEYNEIPSSYKWYFYFNDNVSSRILFYFDGQKRLEHISYVAYMVPAPIEPEILADLCMKISINSEKCKSGEEIYPTDISKEVREAFPIGITTYEDIQEAIGQYQYRFDYPVIDGKGEEGPSLSWYDFVGNNYTRIRCDFDNKLILRKMYIFSGGSD